MPPPAYGSQSYPGPPPAGAPAPGPGAFPPGYRPALASGRKAGLWTGVGIGGGVIVALLVVVGLLGFHAVTGQRQAGGRGPQPTSAAEVSTNFVRFRLARGWTVSDEKQGEVDLQSAGDGQMFVVFGTPDSGVTTPDQAFQSVKASIAKRATSTISSCLAERDRSVGGKRGKIEGFLYTETAPGGGTTQACEVMWVAIVNGEYYGWEDVAASPEQAQLEHAGDAMRKTVTWKQ